MKKTKSRETSDEKASPSSDGNLVVKYDDTRNITRLDPRNSKKAANTRGWWVRIQRNGKVTSQLFSDSRYGGIPGALKAAMAWRDEQLAHLGPRRLRRPHPNVDARRAGEDAPGRLQNGRDRDQRGYPRIPHDQSALRDGVLDRRGRTSPPHVVLGGSARRQRGTPPRGQGARADEQLARLEADELAETLQTPPSSE